MKVPPLFSRILNHFCITLLVPFKKRVRKQNISQIRLAFFSSFFFRLIAKKIETSISAMPIYLIGFMLSFRKVLPQRRERPLQRR